MFSPRLSGWRLVLVIVCLMISLQPSIGFQVLAAVAKRRTSMSLEQIKPDTDTSPSTATTNELATERVASLIDVVQKQEIGTRRKPPPLPEKLLIAYANWNECDEKIIEAVKNGANVIMWFSINLITSAITGEPTIDNGPDWDCVANITYQLREVYNLPTIHMISVGGWNAPHPAITHTAADIYAHWKHWNTEVIARPALGFHGFDGIDWDVEGNDDVSSRYNKFSLPCLDLMGRFSQLAKRDGYLVSMAPCESYLDPTQPRFDLLVNHTYLEWEELAPNFFYHGHNTYAYLLHKFGQTDVSDGSDVSSSMTTSLKEEAGMELVIDTFDWISLQLYEGYSHAEYNITILQQPPANYLSNYIRSLIQGWEINPTTTTSTSGDGDAVVSSDNNMFVNVPLHRLVIGLGNGWTAGSQKFLFLSKEAVQESYKVLASSNLLPRGFMFWNILDEGMLVDGKPFYLASILNEVMHIRPLLPPPTAESNTS